MLAQIHQIASAVSDVRAVEKLRGDQSQRGLADAALTIDDRMLARLGDDRKDVGDLLAAPRREVSPVDRRRRTEGLGHPLRPI